PATSTHSTPLPSTPLFRSVGNGGAHPRRSARQRRSVMANSDLAMRPAATSWGAVLGGWVATIGASVIFAPVVAGLLVVPGTTARDRKSTRLNSSHQIISYA